MPEVLGVAFFLFGFPFFLSIFFVLPAWFYFLLILMSLFLALPVFISFRTAPYVPTRKKQGEAMIKLADLKSNDRVWEIGCGDARILREVYKLGVKECVGFDISFLLIFYNILRSKIRGEKIRFSVKNIWNLEYKNVDVIFCYLLPVAMKRFEAEVFSKLPAGTKLISNSFRLPNTPCDAEMDHAFLYIKK